MEMWRNPFAKKSPDLQQIHLDVSDLEDDKESLDQVVYDEDWSSKLASLYHRKNPVQNEAENKAGRHFDHEFAASSPNHSMLPILCSAEERAAWVPLQSVERSEQVFRNIEKKNRRVEEIPEILMSDSLLDQSPEGLAESSEFGLQDQSYILHAQKPVEPSTSSRGKRHKAQGGKNKPHFAFKPSKASTNVEESLKIPGEAHNSFMAHRLQQLIEESTYSLALVDDHTYTEVEKNSFNETSRRISLMEHLQSLIEDDRSSLCLNEKDVLKRKTKGRQTKIGGRKRALSPEEDPCLLEEENDGEFKDDLRNQFQNDNLSIEAVPCCPMLPVPSIMTTKFWDALSTVSIDEDDAYPVDRLSKTRPGFSGRLQMFLQQENNQRLHLGKFLQQGQQVPASGYLYLKILEKSLEARLTTCKCEMLHNSRSWPTPTISEADFQRSTPIVTAIFNTRVNSDLELDVGRSVQVSFPWREIGNVNGHGKVILCTYFSKMLS